MACMERVDIFVSGGGIAGLTTAALLAGAGWRVCLADPAPAIENVEEILSVPELGFAFIGANDLSISLGHPQQTNHPEVVEAIETAEDACRDAGIPFGAPKHDTEAATDAIEDGYRVLRVGDEIGAVRDSLGSRLDTLRDV